MEEVWELLGATCGRKVARRLSWPILADFGQALGAQDGGKMAEMGAKMEHRWRQDGLRWGLSGHLEADWGVILSILGSLAGDICRHGRSVKMATTMHIFGSWGILLEALEAILERLGQKLGCLGRSWPEVGTFLAARWDKDGENEPR